MVQEKFNLDLINKNHLSMNTIIELIYALVSSILITLLVYFFQKLLNSEGPNSLLLIWNFLCVFFLYISLSSLSNSICLLLSRIIASIFLGSGIILVLVQLSITERSFAELWIQQTRLGHSFGVFSFFLCEL